MLAIARTACIAALLLTGASSRVEASKTTSCDGVQRTYDVDTVNIGDPYLAFGDVTANGEATAGDALEVLRAAVGVRPASPIFDVDGSADENGQGAVTVADALLVLRKALGLPLDGSLLDPSELRCEMVRWIARRQNALGLVEFAPGDARLAATYDQAMVGLAMVAHYQSVKLRLDRECDLTTAEILEVVEKILRFYLARYQESVAGGGFRGFAEFYDPDTGAADYSVGAGGNLVGPNAYVLALASQVYGMAWRSFDEDFGSGLLEIASAITAWFETIARPDGGLRFGTVGGGLAAFDHVSTEHNLSARDGLLAFQLLLFGIFGTNVTADPFCRALAINDFLATKLWDGDRQRFAAGLDAAGGRDERVFTDVFALAGMSPFALPDASSKRALLSSLDGITRTERPLDLNPAVTIDGYGSFDASGIQNEWTAQIAFAYNMTDSGWPRPEPRANLWQWAHLLRQLAAARIDSPDGKGAGLAQAAAAHDSGFDGFRWDSSAIAPASVAWWILASLDFHPFITQTDDLYVY